MIYTYVLYSRKFGRIYIGQTNNLDYRLKKHNDALVRSTKAFIPWDLVYFENFDNRSEAMKREKELKSHKGRAFIRNNMPSWLESVS